MTVFLVLLLHISQFCYGQQQLLQQLQQPLLAAQQQLSPQNPQPFGAQAGQPGSVVDLFRGAAATLSQTLISLLNFKVNWLNQLASNIPQVQNNPTQVFPPSSPLLGLGVQSPAVSTGQPILPAPAPGTVGAGNPLNGQLPPQNQLLPVPNPLQSTQPAAPLQAVAQTAGAVAGNPIAALPAANQPLTNPQLTSQQTGAVLPSAPPSPLPAFTGANPLPAPGQ